MNKGQSKNIRLDHDLIEAIETQAIALAKNDSEIIRWAIRRGLGLGVAPLQINSTLAAKEDLSLFMGEARKLEAIFRHAKSRLTVPRPIGADDADGLRLWREAQATVQAFLDRSESCLTRLEVVSRLLSGMGAEQMASLKEVKSLLQTFLEKSSDPDTTTVFKEVIDWLTAAGV